MPAGRYLVKRYLDREGKLQQNFAAELNENDFLGQIEVESRWPAGYGEMTVIKFPSN